MSKSDRLKACDRVQELVAEYKEYEILESILSSNDKEIIIKMKDKSIVKEYTLIIDDEELLIDIKKYIKRAKAKLATKVHDILWERDEDTE